MGAEEKRLLRAALIFWAAILSAVALSGCAHGPRYITVPCIAKDQQLPAEPPKVSDKLTGRADEDIKTIAGSNIRLRAWGSGLRTILEGCRA